MKRRDREYTDEFRAEAVVKLIGNGWPDVRGVLTRVAGEVGVPAMTLLRWARAQNNTPPNKIVKEKVKELSQLFEDEIRLSFKAAGVVRGEAKYRDLMVGIGIATEKMQLLRGEPTERHGFIVSTEDISQSQERVAEWKLQRQQTRQPSLNGSS